MAEHHFGRFDSPEYDQSEAEALFLNKSKEVKRALDSLVGQQSWGHWNRVDQDGNLYYSRESMMPAVHQRSRSTFGKASLELTYQIASRSLVHDQDTGRAILALKVTQTQKALIGGVLRKPSRGTIANHYLLSGVYKDFELPSRKPMLATPLSSAQGIDQYRVKEGWMPVYQNPSHCLEFDADGRLLTASLGFANPQDKLARTPTLVYAGESIYSGNLILDDTAKLLVRVFRPSSSV